MKYYLLLLLLFISSCGIFKTPEEIRVPYPVFTKFKCEAATPLDSIDPLPVIFVKGFDEEGFYILGLRGDQYTNMTLNSAEVLRYIRGQSSIINNYESCVQRHNEKAPN